MTAQSGRVFGPKPFGGDEAIAWSLRYPLAASVSPFRNWLLGIDASGNLKAMAADVTNLVSAGFADQDQTGSTTAGLAEMQVRQQFVSGFPNSTAGGDAILASDIAVACWAADNATVGKLSNQGGHNRSLLGIALGIDPDNNTPIFYPGPIGWLLARGAHQADNSSGGNIGYPVDAGATTDIGSTTVSTAALMIPRAKRHEVVTSIEIIPSAALSATSGNNRTITIYKVDTLGVAADVIVGTFVTTTALVAHQPALFTLSGTAANLNMLETDILCYSTVHASAGAVIPQSAIRVNTKVG